MCLNPGDIIGGHYRIQNQLGRGGFGSTYLAEELHLPNNPVRVVKEIIPLSNNPCVLQEAEIRFHREAIALHDLGTHPQIPQLFERFQENGKFYLVQEFIEGQPLSEILIPGRRLNEEEVVELLRGILEVLRFVHQRARPVIHRDLKPSNLIQRQQDRKIVLIDFGAVKEISTLDVTSSGEVTPTVAIGTPGYMPAEQLKGHPSYSSDIYAVGIIGIQAITGLNPNDLLSAPRTGEIILRYRLPDQPEVKVSNRLATVLDTMVRYHFKDRYQSVDAVLLALANIMPSPRPKPSVWNLLRQAAIMPSPRPEPSTWNLLRQAAIIGSCGWLLAMLLFRFLETVWISAALWLLISGGLIFGAFARSSVVKTLRLFVIAVIATRVTYFVLPPNSPFWNSNDTSLQLLLVVVLLLASLSGLFAFILLFISKKY